MLDVEGILLSDHSGRHHPSSQSKLVDDPENYVLFALAMNETIVEVLLKSALCLRSSIALLCRTVVEPKVCGFDRGCRTSL